MNNVRRFLQGQADKILAELLRHPQIHLMIGQPQCHLRDLRRKFCHFNPIKLIHIHQHNLTDIEKITAAVLVQFPQRRQFQQPQFPIGHHQKIAASTGRVQDPHRRQLPLKIQQAPTITPNPFKLRPQPIQQQWPQRLEDIGFSGVMSAPMTTGGGVKNGLKQRTENGRRNPAPIQRTGIQQQFPQGPIKSGQRQRFCKQPAIDMRKGRQLLIEGPKPLLRRRIQHLKKLRQLRP